MTSGAPQRLATALADRYRIERELGAGGMATVYLAHDLKHKRKVAMKVLKPELSAALGPERFVLEIETTANLRHPHILPLYDSGEADGFLFYVMPFVEGESLRNRLDRERQLPLDDALQIAREVADALNYAHSRGVIHRDIKPENILLEAGHAAVADFGIAKAVSAAGGTKLTGTGLAVGTPKYMSPEQASGDGEIDGRSDEYALGCVLYEMLAGQPPFSGPTVASVVHQHIAADAPLVTQLRPTVPADVALAIGRALAKSPADRFHAVAQFAEALRRPTGQTPLPSVLAPRSRRLRYALAGVATLLIVAMFWFVRGRLGGDAAPTVGRTTQLTRDPGLELDPAISPDGQLVAYAAGPAISMQIFVRQASGGRTVQLTSDATRSHRFPRWSPDGSRISFQTNDGIYVVPSLGGAPRLVVRAPPTAFKFGVSFEALVGLSWSPDGKRIAYAANRSTEPQVLVVNADGGEPVALPAPPDVNSPAWSPDGKHIAVVSGNNTYVFGGVYLGNVGAASLWAIPVDGSPFVRLTDAKHMNGSPQWMPDSRAILFVSDRGGSPDVYRVRVGRDAAPIDEPQRVTAGMNAHTFTISADGRHLAFAQLRATSNVWSLPVPRAGPVSASGAVPLTTGNQSVENIDVSRDGQWVVFSSDLNGLPAIFKVPANGGEAIQLTTDSVANFAPSWSPDGSRIAFHRIIASGNREILSMNVDGTGREVRSGDLRQAFVPSWSPTGDTLVAQTSLSGNQHVAFLSSKGAVTTHAVPLDVGGDMLAWSPVASEIVYHASDGVRLLDPRGGTRLIASNAADGVEAFAGAWTPDGSAVHYLAHDARGWMIRAVARTGGPTRELVRFDDPSHQPARYGFRMDARRYYLTMGSSESDIWVIDLVQP